MKRVGFVFMVFCLLIVHAEVGWMDALRVNLEYLHNTAGVTDASYSEMKENWDGLNIETNCGYQMIEKVLSNHWESAFSRIDEVATNREDRLVLLAAGSCSGQTNFLLRMSCLVDLALAGRLSLMELKFFETQCMLKDSWGASVLVREYYRPNVSNLILKIERAGGYPNGVTNIFNGADKELYEDAVFDGLIR